MEPAGALLNEDQQDQTHATVPQKIDNCEPTGCPMSPVVGDMGLEATGSPEVADMGASAEPQPWKVERPLPVVPPPQFADAPEKFQRTIERVSDQRLEANLRRDRAIRARGGRATDFYRNGEGVRCDIRDTYSTDSTPRQTSEPLSS